MMYFSSCLLCFGYFRPLLLSARSKHFLTSIITQCALISVQWNHMLWVPETSVMISLVPAPHYNKKINKKKTFNWARWVQKSCLSLKKWGCRLLAQSASENIDVSLSFYLTLDQRLPSWHNICHFTRSHKTGFRTAAIRNDYQRGLFIASPGISF